MGRIECNPCSVGSMSIINLDYLTDDQVLMSVLRICDILLSWYDMDSCGHKGHGHGLR